MRGQTPWIYPNGRLVLGLGDPGQRAHRAPAPPRMGVWGHPLGAEVFWVKGGPPAEVIRVVTCRGSGCHQLLLRGKAHPRDTQAPQAALSGVRKGGAVCAAQLRGGGLGPASLDCMGGQGRGVHSGFSTWAQAHPRLHCWGGGDTRSRDLLDTTRGLGPGGPGVLPSATLPIHAAWAALPRVWPQRPRLSPAPARHTALPSLSPQAYFPPSFSCAQVSCKCCVSGSTRGAL